MPMPDEDEEEILCQDGTMIRHAGCVDVATLPTSIAKALPVKNAKGKKDRLVELIKEDGRWIIKLHLQVTYKKGIIEIVRGAP